MTSNTAYEYKIVVVPLPIDDNVLVTQMNELGGDGWQLIVTTVTNESRLWFMREIKKDNPGGGPPDQGANHMAAVPVTISGVLLDKLGRTIQQVTLVGEASMTGVGVGGGPIEGGPGGQPPGIWGGGNVPMPTPPIHLGPGGEPGGPPSIWPSPGHPEHPIVIPPGIWPNPPEGQAPHPEHPIVIPPPPGTSGPPLEVKVVWGPENGWAVVLVPTGPHPTPSAQQPAGRRG